MAIKKQLDPRIRTLIDNGVRTNHRSLFVMVGDRGRDAVCHQHIHTIPGLSY